MKLYFLQRAPSPTCYPPQGPIGATLGTVMNNFYSSPNKVSTHYIIDYSPSGSGEEDFEICMVLALWGPPPGPPTYYLNKFESPTPKNDSCQVWLNLTVRFQEEDENVKSLRTTHDARKRTAIAHLSFRLR